jgi:type IV secretory pathway TrbL component
MKNLMDRDRIKVNLVATLIGFAIGLALNMLWAMFRGFFLGWNDSAPEWYFNIQNYIHYGIILVSVVFCIGIGNLFLVPLRNENDSQFK